MNSILKLEYYIEQKKNELLEAALVSIKDQPLGDQAFLHMLGGGNNGIESNAHESSNHYNQALKKIISKKSKPLSFEEYRDKRLKLHDIIRDLKIKRKIAKNNARDALLKCAPDHPGYVIHDKHLKRMVNLMQDYNNNKIPSKAYHKSYDKIVSEYEHENMTAGNPIKDLVKNENHALRMIDKRNSITGKLEAHKSAMRELNKQVPFSYRAKMLFHKG